MKIFIGREDGLSGRRLPFRGEEKMQQKIIKLGPGRDTTPEMLEEARSSSQEKKVFYKIDQSTDLKRVMKEKILNS